MGLKYRSLNSELAVRYGNAIIGQLSDRISLIDVAGDDGHDVRGENVANRAVHAV